VTVAAWGLRLGLGVVGLASSSCASEPAGAAITANLQIAPVVEDHPWVIAFLTELGSERPAGVDARLEGRSVPDGRYFGEPIFEGQRRELLAELLATYEAAHVRPPELAVVWEHSPGRRDDLDWRLHFVDRSAGFAVDSDARVILEPRDSLVLLRFGASQRERFAALSGAHVGQRLAFTIDDETLMIPVIHSSITGGQIQLTPNSEGDPKLTAQALVDRLTAP